MTLPLTAHWAVLPLGSDSGSDLRQAGLTEVEAHDIVVGSCVL